MPDGVLQDLPCKTLAHKAGAHVFYNYEVSCHQTIHSFIVYICPGMQPQQQRHSRWQHDIVQEGRMMSGLLRLGWPPPSPWAPLRCWMMCCMWTCMPSATSFWLTGYAHFLFAWVQYHLPAVDRSSIVSAQATVQLSEVQVHCKLWLVW